MDANGIQNPAEARDPMLEKWVQYTEKQRIVTSDQEKLLLELINERNDLKKQLSTQEFDNWTLRGALTQLRQESEDAIKELASIRNDQSLAVCLLDCDGAIFSQEYFKQGEIGGRRAAEALANGLVNYIKSTSDILPAGLRLMAFLFVSKSGLESTLDRSGFCTPEELSAFFKGFVQAHPLFDVIDVGVGKEKADHKLREHLDMFLRNPQTSKIFFGGSHDNGYMGNLAAAQTTGHIKKLVILRTYAQMAREIHHLQLPNFEIPQLFIPNKISTPRMTPSRQYTPLPIQSDALSQYMKSDSPKPPSSPKKHFVKPNRPSPNDTGTNGKHKKRQNGRNPAACNFKYLGGGCTNKNCKFGHDYELTPEELEEMRINASYAPCRYINKGERCPNLKCHLGHKCPRGPDCEYHARGECKFVGADMHT